MGSTVENNGRITSFLGVKGGVGCSTLASLIGRIIAKKTAKRIAIIDATPFPHSLIPSFLGITAPPSRHLSQLQPYQDHLTKKLIETFFSISPEGLIYAPLKQNDEKPLSVHQVLPLLQKLALWFDNLFLDLSSFPNDQFLPLLEKSHSTFLISSLAPTSLATVRHWEKRLLPLHFPLENFNLLFNHEGPLSSISKDHSTWAKHFKYIGNVPFLGEDLSIHLLENRTLSSALEKSLAPICEKINAIIEMDASSDSPSSPRLSVKGAESSNLHTPSISISLEQINDLHQKLLERLRQSGALKEQTGEQLQRQALEPNAREILDQLIQEFRNLDRETSQKLVTETLNLAFGLGPLESLLANEEVTEIMVNGPSHIFVEKRGLLEKTDVQFLNDQQLRTVIERILAPIGRRIDESQPYVDGRLLGGSRINAIIPPLSLNGPILTIRKFSKRKLKVEDLIKFGSLTQEAADFLGACVLAKKNIVVSGGTGSGKTTLLNILSNYIPQTERIVTIEDSAELQLSQEHVVRLESRPANLEGKGQVAIRDLVINALRMRPDRIVVGEVRGGETLDMLQAMNTGHDGSLTTAHANTPRDVLSRLETMALFTGLELPIKAIREQISRAIHLVVQQSRLSNGKRSVTQISEIQGMEGDVIILQDLFTYEEDGGLIRNPFTPSFIEELASIGYKWPGRSEKIKV